MAMAESSGDGGDCADYNEGENKYSDSSMPSIPLYYYYYYYDEDGMDINNELS